jgi:hypothetical protein
MVPCPGLFLCWEGETMTRGRRPEWAAVVQRLDGTAQAKARLCAALEVWTGQRTAAEVCCQLGLGERRFRALREQLLQAALLSLEPRSAGRPPGPAGGTDAQLAQFQAQVSELQAELRAAQVREEIALVLPHLARRRGRGKGARRRQPRNRTTSRTDTSADCGR